LIPQAYIQAWRANAPWPNPAQVEQDLVICRALCDLFSAPALAGELAFRGGTAIHKLLFERPLRYSEDIDLVQTKPGRSARPSTPSAARWPGSASAAVSRRDTRCISCSASHPRRIGPRR
jgi:hypothetical protein